MKALISFLSAALSFAVCDGSQVLQLPAEYDGKNHESACDETRFIAERQLCDATFGLSLPYSHENNRLACSSLKKYKICVADLVRETGCQDTGFLVWQLEPMKQFLRQKNIVCDQRDNASSGPDVSKHPRADAGLCARSKVWAKQFLCADEFQASLQKIQRNEDSEPLPVCRSITKYYVCLSSALQNESCTEDGELSQHMEYFPKVLTEKYREMCVAEMKLASTNVGKRLKVKVLRAIGGARMNDSSVCDGEEATKRFFECGLRFNWIVSQNPVKTKLCSAYRVFRNCSAAIASELNCDLSSDFSKHAIHVTIVLAEHYEHYCVPPKPSMCNEDTYLHLYFDCGLKFVFAVRDAMFSDPTNYAQVLCEIQRAHTKCIGMAKNASHCLVPIGIQTSIDFLDSELVNSAGNNCTEKSRQVQIARARAKFRASKQNCNIREYAGSYFSCGTTFIKSTYPNRPPKDEDCRLYRDFMRCVNLLIVCRSPGDVEVSLKHFTDVLTVGYPELCKDIPGKENETEECDKMALLKEFMSCGLAYYQLFLRLEPQDSDGTQHNCTLLKDYHDCTNDKVLSKKCDGLDDLFANMKHVREYISQRYDLKLHTNCAQMPIGKNVAFLRQQQRSPCDQFKAVKQLVLCGVSFHRMLAAFTQNGSSWHQPESEDRAALVCPLLNEMKDCVQSATNDSGCSGAMLLNAEISVLKKHLFTEFYTTCNATPSTDIIQPHHQSCGLKEFTQAWDACDSVVEDDISLLYRNGSGFRKAVMSHRGRRRLCNDLVGYRKCLNDSADRYHCTPLVPEVADLSNEMLHRLGFAYCSRGWSSIGGWRASLLAAAFASALNLLAQRHSARVT